MKKFVSYSKMSKKKRREADLKQRNDWGVMRPITRRVENAKAYDRKKYWQSPDGLPVFLCELR